MAKYKVIGKGFHGGKIYPNGKRPFIYTEKPFKKVPSWLEAVKAETASEKKKRLALEKKTADADKKTAADNQKDIDDLSFMGEGENVGKPSNVETL